MFIVLVVSITGAHRIGMMVVEKIRVKQQVAIIRDLVGVIVGEAVIGVYLVVSHLMLCSETGVFAVEMVATFGESLVTFSIDTDAIQVVAIIEAVLWVEIHLTAETGFLQGLDAQLAAETPRMGMVITQEDIVLRGHRFVKERVLILVHLHVVVAHMAEEHDAVVLPHLDASVEIEIRHQHGVGKQVDKHFLALVFYGLFVVHIDLSCDRLVTISNRRSSL